MNTRIIFVFFLAILLVSCNNHTKEQRKDNLLRIPVKMNNDELKLSQIADSIRYIPLSNDFILKDIESMKVDDEGNFYIISSDENGVYKFDRKGNFICQISKKGQGPGEYISLSDCDIHEGKISMNNGAGRMLYFDLDVSNGTINYREEKSYKGVSGVPVDIDIKYQTWWRNGLADDGVTYRDNI